MLGNMLEANVSLLVERRKPLAALSLKTGVRDFSFGNLIKEFSIMVYGE
jgi:hypothetical protein